MRRFNLKGKVVRKLKELETEPRGNLTAETGKEGTTDEQSGAVFQVQGGIRYAWRTDVGCIRKNNQDSVILGNCLFGIADGMGGHNGGEIASATLRDGLLRETEGKEPSLELLEEAVKKINFEIWQQQEKDTSLTGMGTTLTILWPTERKMIIGQVGDSRAYLIRNGQLKQMTSDHSMVADMVRRGVLTEEQAACHPMRNYITRAVGTDDTIDVDMSSIPRVNGDRWIVCSDGLYGQISRQELEEAAKGADLEEAAEKLLQLALEHGGKDNISFILMLDESVMEEKGNDSQTDETPSDTVMPENSDQEGVTAQ